MCLATNGFLSLSSFSLPFLPGILRILHCVKRDQQTEQGASDPHDEHISTITPDINTIHSVYV